MLIELTGHPCSGKTYILNKSQFKTLVFKKYSGIFKLSKLFFLTIYYILIDKLIRDIFHIVLISNDSFYLKLVLIFNITDKYYYSIKLKSVKNKTIIDEGAIHILFNILCNDNLLIWDLFDKKNIFQRLPQPKKLILLKTKIDVQIERLNKRGHKRMKNINDFTRITRNISNYIEVNFKGEIHIINNLTEFNEILKSE